jgi:hypothetical protein
MVDPDIVSYYSPNVIIRYTFKTNAVLCACRLSSFLEADEITYYESGTRILCGTALLNFVYPLGTAAHYVQAVWVYFPRRIRLVGADKFVGRRDVHGLNAQPFTGNTNFSLFIIRI